MATDPTDTAGLETVKECRLRLAELMQYLRALLGQLGRDELTARWQAGLDMLE